MEGGLFLANQALIDTVQRPVLPQVIKRARAAAFACKGSFHISLGGQNGTATETLGPKAGDAVFIKLQLPGGLVSSVLDISIPAPTQQVSHSPLISFQCYNKTYRIIPGCLEKVTDPCCWLAEPYLGTQLFMNKLIRC